MQELQQRPSAPVNPMGQQLPRGPVIETARLLLRQHRLDDLEARIPITDDPDHMRYVGGVYDRQENWARILRYVGHWVAYGFGLFAVEERATGRYVGNVGFALFERELGEDFDSAPEAAWMVAPWAAGLGYATEGMAAAMAWHELTYGPMRQVCLIDPTNAGSLRVAAKLGFKPYGEGANRGHRVILLERTPPLPFGAEPR